MVGTVKCGQEFTKNPKFPPPASRKMVIPYILFTDMVARNSWEGKLPFFSSSYVYALMDLAFIGEADKIVALSYFYHNLLGEVLKQLRCFV